MWPDSVARRLAPVLAIVLAACAREEMPPGTGPDFDPPAVVEMFPEYGAAVPDIDEDAFVRFDEPMGDPRAVARVLETSPAWFYEVNAGRRNVRIRPRDGWRQGVVYRFRIPAGLRDMIRNQTREPIDFLFTTGAELSATRTSGRVMDRETVRSVRDASIIVLGLDSIPYWAVSDTGGNFTVPSLPVGDYWAFAFRDQNRNQALDREFEPHDSGHVSLPESGSVVDLEFWMTAPDTTAPLLGAAEATDSLHLRLDFDDFLEPDSLLSDAVVRVVLRESGDEWPVEEFVVGGLAVIKDTTSIEPADSAQVGLVGEELEVPPDTAEEERQDVALSQRPESGAQDSGDVERSRPQRFVTVRLGRALSGGTYDVSARGFLNLRLLVGGGDTTLVYVPPPPPAENPDPESGEEMGDGSEGQDESGTDGAES